MHAQPGNEHLYPQTACPLCKGPARVVFRTRPDVEAKTTWHCESLWRLLRLPKDTEGRLCLCWRCTHAFRLPLFNEHVVYGEEAIACRRAVFAKYFPDQVYGKQPIQSSTDWFATIQEVFSFFHKLFRCVGGFPLPMVGGIGELRLLDWGGGDGYLGETIALLSQKVLGIPCASYCFDSHAWERETRSPYFYYLDAAALAAQDPFDLVLFSHSLEHVAFPIEILRESRRLLTPNGMLLVIVPYDLHTTALRHGRYPHYHQQLFTVRSLLDAMRRSGYEEAHAKLYRSSYRGLPMWNIVAIASMRGATATQRALPSRVSQMAEFGRVFCASTARTLVQGMRHRKAAEAV